MRCIEIADALENGERGSAIDLIHAHHVPILKGDRAYAVSDRVYVVGWDMPY